MRQRAERAIVAVAPGKLPAVKPTLALALSAALATDVPLSQRSERQMREGAVDFRRGLAPARQVDAAAVFHGSSDTFVTTTPTAAHAGRHHPAGDVELVTQKIGVEKKLADRRTVVASTGLKNTLDEINFRPCRCPWFIDLDVET